MNKADVTSYVNDKTQFVSGDDIEDFLHSLENDSKKLFKWFSDG